MSHGVMGVQAHDARLVALMTAQGVRHILTLNTVDFERYPHIVAQSPADVLKGTSAPSSP